MIAHRYVDVTAHSAKYSLIKIVLL